MSRPALKVAITGFGAFPGAPWNPTQALVARLAGLRRPALADIAITPAIFPVSYASVDIELSTLLARIRPDVLLMFGLAARTPYLRVETRARNAVSALWPDASHRKASGTRIVPGGPSALRFGADDVRLREAARATGIDVRLSRDAGRYLCNYLSWRAIEATSRGDGPAVSRFIHVPLVPRATGRRPPRSPGTRRIEFEQLVDAGEAVLMTMIQTARQKRLDG